MDTNVSNLDQMDAILSSVKMVYGVVRNRSYPTNGTCSNIDTNDHHVSWNIYATGLPGIRENDVKKIPSGGDDKNAKNSMYNDHGLCVNT